MQPHKGKRAVFWLAALLSALSSARTLAAAAVAAHHVTLHLWFYTAAAVPRSLHAALAAALLTAQRLCDECGDVNTADENGDAAVSYTHLTLPTILLV